MSFLNKKKFVKLAESIDNLGFDGKGILGFIEDSGYDEFLFNSNEIITERDVEVLILIAQDVHLVITKDNDNYSLSVE